MVCEIGRKLAKVAHVNCGWTATDERDVNERGGCAAAPVGAAPGYVDMLI